MKYITKYKKYKYKYICLKNILSGGEKKHFGDVI